jgi:hypothetical protein
VGTKTVQFKALTLRSREGSDVLVDENEALLGELKAVVQFEALDLAAAQSLPGSQNRS